MPSSVFLVEPTRVETGPTKALLLLGDRSPIGACRSLEAWSDMEEEEIVLLREAGSAALPLSLVMSAPLGVTKSSSGYCLGDSSTAGALGQ
jgi:hypothetical protein